MKKFYILAIVAAMFAACATDVTEDVAIEAPETLKVSFEEDTRIQLNEAGKTVWTKGDLVSVFYLSNANEKWQFQGETGARVGNLKRVTTTEATQELSNVVVVYPYNENHYINPKSCNVRTTLPAVQHYLKNSYGLDGNILISQSEYNQFSLKNVCGWIKLQLTGNGEKVQSITLKGNNGEQVAGEIYINSADATVALAADMGGADDDENSAGGNLVFDDTIVKELTLDCGEGVTLSAEATAFYIGLPPQEFEKGVKLVITTTNDVTMTKSTSKSLIIERNTIQPMAALEFTPSIPNNQIWYTSSDGNVVTPYKSNVFGAQIVSNTYENGKGIITFNDDVTTIGNNAFFNRSNLTSVIIGNSVTSIGEWAFYNCTSLTSVTIGNSVTSIGSCAFRDCTLLTSVTINNEITSVDIFAFLDCISLKAFYGKPASEDNRCLVIDGVLNSFAPAGLTEYTIPDSITSIGGSAFRGCSYIKRVAIGNSVTSIGSYAFSDCSLMDVKIPDSVTTIEFNAFYDCTSLTSVTIGNGVTSIDDGEFYGCSSLKAFYGKFASEDNRCLIVNGVLYRFAPAGLTEYTIPDSVTSIGERPFQRCSDLCSIVIPNSVASIGDLAFTACTSLTSVYCKSSTPPAMDVDVNNHIYSPLPFNLGMKIYVPRNSYDAYKLASGWSSYAAYIEPYDFE